MEFNGIPLHPLVVHAAVVLTPLAVVAAIGYAAVPGWRDWLRWPMAVAALLSVASVWTAYLSGEDLLAERFAAATGAFAERLDDHQTWAERLRIGASVFAALAIVTAWLHHRTGPTRVLLLVATAAAAAATGALVFLTGDAGARATWT